MARSKPQNAPPRALPSIEKLTEVYGDVAPIGEQATATPAARMVGRIGLEDLKLLLKKADDPDVSEFLGEPGGSALVARDILQNVAGYERPWFRVARVNGGDYLRFSTDRGEFLTFARAYKR